jgi:hypothetical protein
MKRLVFLLALIVACLSFACADQPARYEEYIDDLGTCRQYTQTHSHWNHSTIFVFDDFAHDRVYVSMNITAKRMGAVKLVLRAKREGAEVQQIRLKSFGHGGKGANLRNTVFGDESSEHFPVWPSEAPFTGMFQPDIPLSKIDGSSMAKWTLLAINRDGHTPEIDNWSIDFCKDTAAATGGLGLAPQGTPAATGGASAQAYIAPVYTPSAPPPKQVYTGPNMFQPGFLRNFFARFFAMVLRVTRNYNEANFYVSEVNALQSEARQVRDGLFALKAAKHSGK